MVLSLWVTLGYPNRLGHALVEGGATWLHTEQSLQEGERIACNWTRSITRRDAKRHSEYVHRRIV